MSYTPTNWKNGDIITADKLNKIENAIGAFIVEVDNSNNTSVLNASYNQIKNSINNGKFVIMYAHAEPDNFEFFNFGILSYCSASLSDNEYVVTFIIGAPASPVTLVTFVSSDPDEFMEVDTEVDSGNDPPIFPTPSDEESLG